MLRAAAAPERFLDRGGFVRFVAEHGSGRPRAPRPARVFVPPDLEKFLEALRGRAIGDFVPVPAMPSFASLLEADGAVLRPELVALLAGALPIGETRSSPRELVVYFLADAPLRGVVAAISPGKRRLDVRLLCRGAAELAVLCSMHALDEELEIPRTSIVDEEAAAAGLDRARLLANLLTGKGVTAAARKLALRPLDEPAVTMPNGKQRSSALALGMLTAAFFLETEEVLGPHLVAHASSADAIVREAAALYLEALAPGATTTLAHDLAKTRARARRAIPPLPSGMSDESTRQIIAQFALLPPNAESFVAVNEREEMRLALAELGSRTLVPELLARALTGEISAVDMLSALDDASLVGHLVSQGELDVKPPPAVRGVRAFESAVVRMLANARDRDDGGAILRRMLEASPMTNWREGLERGVLVRELVAALGELADADAAPLLVGILESTSQEHRPIVPHAAWALGRLRHLAALDGLERLLRSPKDAITCEAVWAVGAIAYEHAEARERARTVLEQLAGLEAGAEVTRLAALAKVNDRVRPAQLHRAIERALREPGFRQEETSRRQVWGLRALEDLATVSRRAPAFLHDHETVRYFVTRDDHRVRKAAVSAFRAWGVFVPNVRSYFSFAVPGLEQRGGIDALHEAVRDPLGIFRHNVATRLAELGDPRSARPLAEATARLFVDPATSTYEYDDAPPHLGAFVRALARLNQPEGNDVLIEGLRSDNHQVRAVIAENAPDDARFVPELMAMLGDSRSFLRGRAEKSLMQLGVIPTPIDPGTTEVAIVPVRRVEG